MLPNEAGVKFVTLSSSEAVSRAAGPNRVVLSSPARGAGSTLPRPRSSVVRLRRSGRAATTPDILASLGHATFIWDLATDEMRWLDGAEAIFGDTPAEALATGAAFAAMIEPSQREVRSEVVKHPPAADPNEEVPYRIEYGVRTSLSAPMMWIEECGCWFAGPDGRPAAVHGIMRIDDDRHAREEHLVRLSQHDALTGEFNRSHLVRSLATAIENAERFRSTAAFMVVGIDHLSRINDAFGFDVADEVICELAARIRARLRSGDILGRFSGNKFGLILKDCGLHETAVAAERFLGGVRKTMVPTRSGPVAVTVSVGAVSIPRHARGVDDAINRAQEALEMAKARRRGSFAMWQPNVAREEQRRLNIRVTNEIVTALDEQRIGIAFEPVVQARTRGEVVFYESLVRLRQDKGEFLLGPEIVPVAEKLGLIRLIDQRVLELVAAELARHPEITLSLNISPATTGDPDWWASIQAILKGRPDIAQRLIVEITETAAIHNLDDLRGFISRLKNFGCRIAIDDFGAGYTSFRNLRKLGVDIVKIDGGFVRNVTSSADDRTFVQTLIELARRLGVKTVAEWVQDEEAAQLLADLGCDYIQGRLVGLASLQRPWLSDAGK